MFELGATAKDLSPPSKQSTSTVADEPSCVSSTPPHANKSIPELSTPAAAALPLQSTPVTGGSVIPFETNESPVSSGLGDNGVLPHPSPKVRDYELRQSC